MTFLLLLKSNSVCRQIPPINRLIQYIVVKIFAQKDATTIPWQTTLQSYRERLNRVTAFLHANLETDIGIEAFTAAYSTSYNDTMQCQRRANGMAWYRCYNFSKTSKRTFEKSMPLSGVPGSLDDPKVLLFTWNANIPIVFTSLPSSMWLNSVNKAPS